MWKDSARTLLLVQTGGKSVLEGKRMRIRPADAQAERIFTFAGRTMTIAM